MLKREAEKGEDLLMKSSCTAVSTVAYRPTVPLHIPRHGTLPAGAPASTNRAAVMQGCQEFVHYLPVSRLTIIPVIRLRHRTNRASNRDKLQIGFVQDRLTSSVVCSSRHSPNPPTASHPDKNVLSMRGHYHVLYTPSSTENFLGRRVEPLPLADDAGVRSSIRLADVMPSHRRSIRTSIA
ncbi:hypothetical protein N656DRAFT_406447 [Canariomyces notabilis]|uniref:Uncharacterized protein n=1 Tax=Canariomyces notabilis TaxID=2074819 RepID=A0AAN6TKT9_9PEZI|nr:hypothetical protein N656DRAFT_406447 [Canariomyces arenarius]